MLDDIKKALWATADKLRANMDAAEYKHLVLGLIFIKYISDILSSVPMLLPSVELMDRFEGIAAEFEKKRSENFAMIGTLAAMRDELLPRLISGQLRLPEAQAQREDALA